MGIITIGIDMLPLIKNLEKLEKSFHNFSATVALAKEVAAKAKKRGRGRPKQLSFIEELRKIASEEKAQSAIEIQDAQLRALHKQYVDYMNGLESTISTAIQDAFASLVSGTKRHTNRAAGSWALSWNEETEKDDIGFLHPEDAPDVTFYNNKSGKNWYPEAPVANNGFTKILGVHDWSWIEERHNAMVTKVLQEMTFTREWGKTNAKGRMIAQKTVYIYNSCPYIMEATNGSLSDMSVNPGALVATTIWDTMNSIGSKRSKGKTKHKFTLNA